MCLTKLRLGTRAEEASILINLKKQANSQSFFDLLTARAFFNLDLNRDSKNDMPTLNSKLSDHRVYILVSLMFLFGFLFVASQRSSFITLDLGVNAWAASINMGSFQAAAVEISIIFDTIPIEIYTGVLVVIFTLKNRWQYGSLLIGAIVGDVLIVSALKNLIMSPRPWNEVINQTTYSFPSGHVAGNVVFFGIVVYFAWSNWASARTRLFTGGLYVALILLVGFDRIYLNVHWLSDVVGGFLFGAFWLLFTIWVFKRIVRK